METPANARWRSSGDRTSDTDAGLHDDERDQQDDARREQADDERAPPALGVAPHEREDEREQRAAERDRAQPVDAGRVSSLDSAT